MSRTSTTEELAAGAVIDNRYQVVSLLGSGGFANVYMAKHVHLDRTVALKVLHPPLNNAANDFEAPFSKRFEQEARIAAALDHPNIVGIFDYGFLPSGEPYIAMAYLDGQDLEEELEENGSMSPRRAVKLMQGCLEGVAHGHDRSVVHKDLKPSNLYLVNPGARDERLVVLDFGIARVFNDPAAKITQSGLFSGTPAYLAPEYIREQIVSPAVDVYQLGLILIEMLTGRPAVEADGPMGYLLAHCMGRLSVNPEFFETELGQVCKKAIAIDPDERFQSAGDFADALEAAIVPEAFPANTLEGLNASGISHAEVAAFAQTLPEAVLADTGEWSSRTAEPNETPGPKNRAHSVPEARLPAQQVPTILNGSKQADEEHSGPNLVAIGVVGILLLLGIVGGAAALLGDEKERPEVPLAPVETTAGVTSTTVDLEGFDLEPIPDPGREAVRATAATHVSLAIRDASEQSTTAAEKAAEPVKVRTRPKTRPKTKPVAKPDPKPEPKPKPTTPTIMIGN